MGSLYQEGLAYIQAAAFGGLAQGAAPEVLRLLNNAAIQIRRVVDVGCGAGPLTAALVKAGFDATGIDSSDELLGIARGAVPRARFINKSIYDAEIPSCEAILAIGEPLTYDAEDADAHTLVEGFLERASEVLPAGGMLIFDVIEFGEPSLAGRLWSSGDDWAVLVDTKENQNSRTLIRDIETFRRVDRFHRRDAKSTAYGCSTPIHCAINSVRAGLQWKPRSNTAHSVSARVAEPSFALAFNRRWLR
jgi:SAM-dependent methyltransferase